MCVCAVGRAAAITRDDGASGMTQALLRQNVCRSRLGLTWCAVTWIANARTRSFVPNGIVGHTDYPLDREQARFI